MYKTSKVNGAITVSSQGLVIIGIRTPNNNRRTNCIDIRNALGNSSSRQLMSLENLFITLPTGFVSKNRTGACRTARTILSWRRWEHLRETRRNPYARMTTNTKAPPTRQPYIMRFILSLWSAGCFFVSNASHTSGEALIAKNEEKQQYKKRWITVTKKTAYTIIFSIWSIAWVKRGRYSHISTPPIRA